MVLTLRATIVLLCLSTAFGEEIAGEETKKSNVVTLTSETFEHDTQVSIVAYLVRYFQHGQLLAT